MRAFLPIVSTSCGRMRNPSTTFYCERGYSQELKTHASCSKKVKTLRPLIFVASAGIGLLCCVLFRQLSHLLAAPPLPRCWDEHNSDLSLLCLDDGQVGGEVEGWIWGDVGDYLILDSAPTRGQYIHTDPAWADPSNSQHFRVNTPGEMV